MRETDSPTPTSTSVETFDAVVVGGGFAGLYALHRLRSMGLSVRVFETGSGVGGVWFWNRYPGARCDVESMEYSYQFSEELQQEWEWSERYSPQPEILKYINHVADRFDLRRDIQFETRVTSAHFDDDTERWSIRTDRGDLCSAKFCIMATGCLSAAITPDFEGLEGFKGSVYHTARWPHERVDFSGKRVGVIGTGSSAIQSIPIIAEEAERLFVFQRTPNYTIPAHNAPLDRGVQNGIKARYKEFRDQNAQNGFGLDAQVNDQAALEVSAEERQRVYEERWAHGGIPFITAFIDLTANLEANETAAEFIRTKLRETVDDPKVAELLSPDHAYACKRPCVDTGYWATFNRPNVELIDVSEHPIERITPKGLVTDGTEFELDCLVLATGFDAMTGALARIDIRGRRGVELKEKWSAGPRAYLGLGVAGFPNFFTITGPGSPALFSNMVPSIEQHVNWIADCIDHMRDRTLSTIEATAEAQDAWVAHVDELARETVFLTCDSYYVGANIPGKPRVFTLHLGYGPYVEKCNEVAAKGYEGFALR